MARTRPCVDVSRVAIWGWSGGGSNTLNAMFRKPGVYQVGIAVAPKPQPHLYNAWFQEIYMQTPESNPDGYRRAAPINFAEGLKGHLLIIQGTGESNTHLQIAEGLVDRLIELGKRFDYMAYPNRDHGLRESRGTAVHLRMLINTVAALQLKRNGATLTLNVNGTTDTDTMSATNDTSNKAWCVGADNGAGWYAGKVEFVRLFRVAKSHRLDAYARLINPRAPSVVADWVFTDGGNSIVVDRGAYGLHAAVTGSPAFNGTPISANHAPVLAIGANRNNSADRRAYMNVAGVFYPVTY